MTEAVPGFDVTTFAHDGRGREVYRADRALDRVMSFLAERLLT